jgi:hypothetical protein
MKHGIAEIIKKASELKTEKEKIAYLQESSKTCIPLILMFRLMFDPKVLFDLPEGDPPYKPQPKESDLQNYLYHDFRRIKYFIISRIYGSRRCSNDVVYQGEKESLQRYH